MQSGFTSSSAGGKIPHMHSAGRALPTALLCWKTPGAAGAWERIPKDWGLLAHRAVCIHYLLMLPVNSSLYEVVKIHLWLERGNLITDLKHCYFNQTFTLLVSAKLFSVIQKPSLDTFLNSKAEKETVKRRAVVSCYQNAAAVLCSAGRVTLAGK